MTAARPHPESGDATLIAGIRAGDDNAMAALYDRFSQIVYSVALRVLGDTGTAEDVLQEVFMQLWRNPQAFDGSRGSLGAWLAVITRHRAIDHLRRRKDETDIDDIVVSVDARLENETEKHMFLSKIRSVMAGLPEDQRRAVEMSFFDGLTHSEIAHKTGDPLGTVKSRIRTALITVRKAVAA